MTSSRMFVQPHAFSNERQARQERRSNSPVCPFAKEHPTLTVFDLILESIITERACIQLQTFFVLGATTA